MENQSISIQAEEARGCLAQISRIAEQYRELSARAKAMEEELSACWKGNSGDGIRIKIQEWVQRQEPAAENVEQKVSAVENYIRGMEELDAKLAGML